MPESAGISIVIPTYKRGRVVLDTIRALEGIRPPDCELLIVDQSPEHPPGVERGLAAARDAGSIRWIRLATPSIPAAMNVGLTHAAGKAVMFLDDDIIPDPELVARHVAAQSSPGLVAGMVLQPGEVATPLAPGERFRFNSTAPANIGEFMGGNFSIDRLIALQLGGFDENFVGAAYRFEAEFAHRYVAAHGPVRFEPGAIIHHLAISEGGTRAHGHHLRTMQPSHTVGAYYFLMRARPPGWRRAMCLRPLRAVRTRHHLRSPWWIPLTLLSELRGMLLARKLCRSGPKLVGSLMEPSREIR